MNSSRSQYRPNAPKSSLNKCAESFLPEQSSLFPAEDSIIPGSLNDESVVRALVTDAIKTCSKSRDQIAEEMTLLLGDRVTVRMLNSYTSEAAEQHRWPAQYTRAFCHVVQDWALLRCITERSGFHLITSAEADLLELGRQYLIQKRATARLAQLEKELAGVAL